MTDMSCVTCGHVGIRTESGSDGFCRIGCRVRHRIIIRQEHEQLHPTDGHDAPAPDPFEFMPVEAPPDVDELPPLWVQLELRRGVGQPH